MEPKLLPKPSIYAYVAEGQRYAARHVKVIVVLFFVWYAFVSYVTVPKLYEAFIASPEQSLATESEITALPEAPTQQSQLEPSPTPTNIPLPVPVPDATPIEIVIPSIDVKSSIEQVGQTKTFEMDVPKNAANTAWYVYGAKPGQEGNAVINGHYDTPSGKAAVFFKLKTIKPGEEVQIIAQDGSQTNFAVEKVEVINTNEFPAEYVFHTKPGKNLNLITCGGIWDPIARNYKQRIVVYTTLKEG